MLLMEACSGGTARDWLDYLSAWSGLIGALLAGAAIAYAAWQSAQAKKDMIRERRLDFELRLLADIRYQMSVTGLQHISGYVGALISEPSDETDVPVLRASLGIKAGPLGKARFGEIRAAARERNEDERAELMPTVTVEVDAAITRRLLERN